MTSENRRFHIGDVITVATGRLVALRHIEAVYDLCGYMTGGPGLMTHQLPRASRECEPALRAQHPGLTSEPIPTIKSLEDAERFLETLYPLYGQMVEVAPLSPGDHTVIDPIAEIRMINPSVKIFTLGD